MAFTSSLFLAGFFILLFIGMLLAVFLGIKTADWDMDRELKKAAKRHSNFIKN